MTNNIFNNIREFLRKLNRSDLEILYESGKISKFEYNMRVSLIKQNQKISTKWEILQNPHTSKFKKSSGATGAQMTSSFRGR